MSNSFNDVTIEDPGHLSYTNDDGFKSGAVFPLLLIRMAWDRGCVFEDLADGFGPGLGTRDDWSAIRDSSHEATEKMLERALNFIAVETGNIWKD